MIKPKIEGRENSEGFVRGTNISSRNMPLWTLVKGLIGETILFDSILFSEALSGVSVHLRKLPWILSQSIALPGLSKAFMETPEIGQCSEIACGDPYIGSLNILQIQRVIYCDLRQRMFLYK